VSSLMSPDRPDIVHDIDSGSQEVPESTRQDVSPLGELEPHPSSDRSRADEIARTFGDHLEPNVRDL
jgi:hypothetical protein